MFSLFVMRNYSISIIYQTFFPRLWFEGLSPVLPVLRQFIKQNIEMYLTDVKSVIESVLLKLLYLTKVKNTSCNNIVLSL